MYSNEPNIDLNNMNENNEQNNYEIMIMEL